MMRGRPSTHLKHLLITGAVGAIIFFLLFEVTTAAGSEYKDLEGPVEFTGPGFQTDPYILLAIVGLTLVIFGIGMKYMRMGRAGDSE
uniref:Hypothetical membrane protein n=1 Tax=uncultured virus TaxID=340016 RepID=D5L2L8_9VIRU|nr:hypothetical membrane protein [uncultured virus]